MESVVGKLGSRKRRPEKRALEMGFFARDRAYAAESQRLHGNGKEQQANGLLEGLQ